MNLYWVTTEDHAADWFVLANSAEEAASYYEDAEGYEPGDATTELILKVPDEIIADEGWPSEELLRSCGAKILTGPPARVVQIGDRRFSEGLV